MPFHASPGLSFHAREAQQNIMLSFDNKKNEQNIMLVICFLSSVLLPVQVHVLVLGTSPVILLGTNFGFCLGCIGNTAAQAPAWTFLVLLPCEHALPQPCLRVVLPPVSPTRSQQL